MLKTNVSLWYLQTPLVGNCAQPFENDLVRILAFAHCYNSKAAIIVAKLIAKVFVFIVLIL